MSAVSNFGRRREYRSGIVVAVLALATVACEPTWTLGKSFDSDEHGVVVQGKFDSAVASNALNHGIAQLNRTDIYVHKVSNSNWYDTRAILAPISGAG